MCLDYLLTNGRISIVPESVCSLIDFNMVHPNDDHVPVVGNVMIHPIKSNEGNLVVRRKNLDDRHSLADPSVCEKVIAACKNLPWVYPAVEGTSQAHVIRCIAYLSC